MIGIEQYRKIQEYKALGLAQTKTAKALGVFCKPKFLTFAKLFPQAPVGNFYVNPNSFD
jgi:hypothetical protein